MFKYILKRIIFFIPTFLIISVLTFGLSKLAPGDPVKLALGSSDQGGAGQLAEMMAGETAYLEMAEKLGMNLPVFYFDITSRSMPDTLYKIPKRPQQEALTRLVKEHGNWPEIQTYFRSIKTLELSLFDIQRDSTNYAEMRKVRENCNKLYTEYKSGKIERYLEEIGANVGPANMANAKALAEQLISNYQAIKTNATPAQNSIPKFVWYGADNQYHHWLFGAASWFGESAEDASRGFFRGDFGISYLDKRPVSSIIGDALPITIMMNIIALFFAYVISIPLGVYSAVKKGSIFDSISTVIVFGLYSLPVFWVATMLIVFITTDEYGMDWFPTFGLGQWDESAGLFANIGERAWHLALPIVCMTYGSLAYLSRQMRGGVLSIMRSDYIRTARAKGLDEGTVIWKHVFRNSLIPIITIFAYLFPGAISGALVIEMIFSIPGMGKIMFEAIVARNYPIVFTVMMFAAILTMVGNLVADLLYAVVDPRISFK